MKQFLKSVRLLKTQLFFIFLLIFSTTSGQTAFTLRNGVVAYWSFDENFKADIGGESFDLTTSALAPTISGNDATFSAAASFVRANSNYLKTLSNVNGDDADFTCYARYMPTAAIVQRCFVMESSQSQHAISFGLRNDGQSSGIPRSELYSENSTSSNSVHFLPATAGSDYGVSINNWNTITITYSKTSQTYTTYINGVSAGTLLQNVGTLKGGGLVIGSFRNNNDRFWQGYIDEVTIWNRVLSAPEIAAIHTTKIKMPLQKASLTAIHSSDASFSISSGENLTAYYKVIAGNATCPTAQALKTDVLATTLVLNTTSSTIDLSSLIPETGYKLCHVAMDANNRLGAVLETSFTTTSVLPVTWLSFTADQQNGNILLKWSTVSEWNAASFTVQHSTNGIDFSNIGSISAAGNSSSVKQYQFTHIDPAGGHHFYRLQQTDIDGHTTYSDIINLSKDARISSFTVLSNPVQDKQLRVKLTRQNTLGMYTPEGNLIWQKKLPSGNHTIDVSSCSKGIYFLKAETTIRRIVIK